MKAILVVATGQLLGNLLDLHKSLKEMGIECLIMVDVVRVFDNICAF